MVNDFLDSMLAAINDNADKFQLMNISDHVVEILMDRHGLSYYVDYYKHQSKSQTIPYHNKYHTWCMIANCYEGARFTGNGVNIRSLLIAALMHDANHTGGQHPDDVNIKIALSFFDDAHSYVINHKEKFDTDDNNPLTTSEYAVAIETLKITKYPYEGDPVTTIQKIIRDADLMQVYEYDQSKLAKQFLGLKEEMEIAHNRTYTNEEWADGCYNFQTNVRWHTPWAERKAVLLNYEAARSNLREILRKG